MRNEDFTPPHEEKTDTNERPTVYSVDFGSEEQRFSAEEPHRNKRYDDDGFWDLGEVRRKVYQAPEFSGMPVENTVIEGKTETKGTLRPEPVPPAPTNGTPFSSKLYTRPADRTEPSRSAHIPTSRYAPSRPEAARSGQTRQNDAPRPQKTERVYDCGGLLIRHVEIKPWGANVRFYERFAAEAELFHERTGAPCEAVSFFSYVPQYSKMNDKQQNFYLHVRDSIRRGEFIEAELSYLLLYVFEIINLPHKIPPETGVRLLSDIWLNYRDSHPRLDVFLCEWLADYCLIHQIPLPRRLTPIIPQIVQRAQFKEIYLDLLPDSGMETLARTLLEFSSDYDYRRSRYYKDHAEAYETHLPAALAAALRLAQTEKRGIFSFEKKYRLTRDAYCGAVTPAEIKRRIDVEFHSFTRPIETREIITNLVKYAENQLRLTLKIKAKLGTGTVAENDIQAINAYFAPMMPEKKGTKAAAEAEYLKFYEADTTGFDFSAAAAIEQSSWDNTDRLTASEAAENAEKNTPAEGEKTAPNPPVQPTPAPFASEELSPSPNGDAEPTDRADEAEKACLRAAAEGNFRRFCRAQGYFAEDMASRINEIFLDLLGDIVLTEENGDYLLIEDYREDVLKWLS